MPTTPPPTTATSTSSTQEGRESQSEGKPGARKDLASLADQDAAAVEVQDLARDVAGGRGGEEEDGAGHVFGGGDPAQGDRGGDRLAVFAGQGLGGHVGVDPARSHRINPDPRRELGRP